MSRRLLALPLALLVPCQLGAQEQQAVTKASDSRTLALGLENPLSNLSRIPASYTVLNVGGEDLIPYLKVSPTFSAPLTSSWDLVSRLSFGYSDTFDGVQDTYASFLLTPDPTGSWSWGVGPAFRFPSRDYEIPNAGYGIAAGVVWQETSWTIGGVSEYLRYAEADFGLTQASVAYTTRGGTTLAIRSDLEFIEQVYSINILAEVSQIVTLGGFSMRIGLGVGRHDNDIMETYQHCDSCEDTVYRIELTPILFGWHSDDGRE